VKYTAATVRSSDGVSRYHAAELLRPAKHLYAIVGFPRGDATGPIPFDAEPDQGAADLFTLFVATVCDDVFEPLAPVSDPAAKCDGKLAYDVLKAT
jgi:hypothetical protein